jgi:hypothetical protein
MSTYTTTEVIARLKRLEDKLDHDGRYNDANTVWLAYSTIQQLEERVTNAVTNGCHGDNVTIEAEY